MKILHISTPLSWRGGEQQVAYLLQGMKKLGHECALLCPENAPLGAFAADLYLNAYTYTKKSGLSLNAAKKVAILCRKQPFDIIHAHDAQAHSIAVMANALFGAKTPIVVSRRVDFKVAQSYFSAWKYNHSSVVAIACVSNAIAEMVRADVKNPSRVLTIHSGIDAQRFSSLHKQGILHRELGLNPDIKLIGNVSALADHKDYPTFLRTLVRVFTQLPNTAGIICGKGPLEEEIKKQCSELGLNERVFFLGFRRDVPQVLRELDVFFFPSKTEGLGTSLLDAMASEVPIVATRAGGIPEIIQHQHNGLLADVGNDQILAHNIIHILESPELRTSLIANGLHTVHQFSTLNMVGRTIALYEKVLR